MMKEVEQRLQREMQAMVKRVTQAERDIKNKIKIAQSSSNNTTRINGGLD